MTTGLPETPEVVTLPPDVGSAYGNGWNQLWKHFWELLLAGIIFVAISWGLSWLVSLLFSVSLWGMETEIVSEPVLDWASIYWAGGYGIVSLLEGLLVGYPLMTGMGYVFLTAARGESVEIKDLFIAFKNYWNVVLAYLILAAVFVIPTMLIGFLLSAFTFFGVILIICWAIAAVILGCKLALVPLLLVDKKMKAMEAIQTSWEWTRGYAGTIFLTGLLSIPIVIAGFVCLIIGVIPAYMWIYTSFASLYHAIRLENDPEQESGLELLEEPAY